MAIFVAEFAENNNETTHIDGITMRYSRTP